MAFQLSLSCTGNGNGSVRGAVQPSPSSTPFGGLSRPLDVWTRVQMWGRMKGTERKPGVQAAWGYVWDAGFHGVWLDAGTVFLVRWTKKVQL